MTRWPWLAGFFVSWDYLPEVVMNRMVRFWCGPGSDFVVWR